MHACYLSPYSCLALYLGKQWQALQCCQLLGDVIQKRYSGQDLLPLHTGKYFWTFFYIALITLTIYEQAFAIQFVVNDLRQITLKPYSNLTKYYINSIIWLVVGPLVVFKRFDVRMLITRHQI